LTLTAPDDAAGLHVVTADLRWGDWDLREWTEMMIEVASPSTGNERGD
jgi:hypothetical protein